ncbi:MAG TPA: ROK family protein [Acidimicrobiia bacterium]
MVTTVGLDLGGTKLLAIRLEDRAVVETAVLPTPDDAGELTKAAIDGVRAVWREDVEAIGVGIAGLVRFPEGVFVWGPHVAGTGIPVRADLQAEFDIPAVVDNDANAAAHGELVLGSATGHDHVLVVTLGTGIGGAIVLDGQVRRGASFAGEFGHVLFEADGLPCACGRRGCWETVASGPALARLAAEHIAGDAEGPLARRLGPSFSAEDVTEAAEEGDETARALVGRIGEAFGRGLANLIAVFDPQMVVVGGGLGSVGEVIIEPARRVVADVIHGGSHRPPPPIVAAGLGASAGAVGAAVLAADLVGGSAR